MCNQAAEEEGSRLKFPKDSRTLHPHAGLNKGHYSCLTQEDAGEAPEAPNKGKATGSLKEAKGHICAVEDLVGSPRWHPHETLVQPSSLFARGLFWSLKKR